MWVDLYPIGADIPPPPPPIDIKPRTPKKSVHRSSIEIVFDYAVSLEESRFFIRRSCLKFKEFFKVHEKFFSHPLD